MIAIVVVRDGVIPAGTEECVAEAGGRAIVIGTGVGAIDWAGGGSGPGLGPVRSIEAGAYSASGYATIVARTVHSQGLAETIVLPGSPDGRDLAPRLAFELGWPLVGPAVLVEDRRALIDRCDGRLVEEVATDGPFVATLIPGIRGVGRHELAQDPRHGVAGGGGPDDLAARPAPLIATPPAVPPNPELLGVLPPDPATMDLVEAPRIVAGGQGLGSADRFEQLGRIATRLGASVGGTRVASDAGWIPFERQIGTTGVAVNPRVYIAFAISGATQHTSGLGSPQHVIAVNTDASCPMMAMADVAIVSDANAVLDALERKLGSSPG